MTPRERVRLALEHRETDRVPADLGSTQNTSITRFAYKRLRSYLELPPVEPRIMSENLQVVHVDEDVRQALGIDTIGLPCKPPDVSRKRMLGDHHYVNEWGIELKGARIDGRLLYFEAISSPLANLTDPRELDDVQWPDPHDPGRYRGLREEARRIHEETPYALVGHNGDTSLFQKITYLRGMESSLIDSIANPDLFSAIIERILKVQMARMGHYLDAVGEYLDVVSVGDDLGSQQGLLMSPDTYRAVIKPFHAELFSFIKGRTAAKLHMHCCGSIAEVIPDLMELGVDVINPVQIAAVGMEPRSLKKRFGDRIAFWGGIDTQGLLPTGDTGQVQAEVDRIVSILGADGGYVLNPSHNIQADVPPENVVALFQRSRHLDCPA